ncbi:ATPase family AAA domain-containing protein 2 [Thecamonas trahens ATCC 50062]|uniref:ATPase family AAA domain-containing protein 2 n=1 Tax=Thecamonas trahens ATCC 50062 TaxID=461836 RepID=A0A0L0D8D8_THETB|nr:ATPase family AAA domain-containing protein 2 [Thecamonas trahens ATCC 50062]KNC48346.1 ATPase family AAA domain-containing protein 2 [Thecamonas trahens ATCC 50062]|eukprot:XP_013758471.1 ATPase family AAA domain-containing protein 2 [Thecamonas trahens ATCC 50062]
MSTAVSDMDFCFICVDGGELLVCSSIGCPLAYHPACLRLAHRPSPLDGPDDDWFCPRCRAEGRGSPVPPSANHFDDSDEACYLCVEGGQLLCCERCTRTYHSRCLARRHRPPLDADDDDEWVCPLCLLSPSECEAGNDDVSYILNNDIASQHGRGGKRSLAPAPPPREIPVDSECYECGRSDGALVACDDCPRVFHDRCVVERYRRDPDAHPDELWHCPICVVAKGLGYSLRRRDTIAPPAAASAPTTPAQRQSRSRKALSTRSSRPRRSPRKRSRSSASRTERIPRNMVAYRPPKRHRSLLAVNTSSGSGSSSTSGSLLGARARTRSARRTASARRTTSPHSRVRFDSSASGSSSDSSSGVHGSQRTHHSHGPGGHGHGRARHGPGKNKAKLAGKAKSGTAAEPIAVNPDITFDSVGGLDDHIRALKELVVLPLVYPETFAALGLHAPAGVLFHGPPGTGKTLMAQAVANAASASGTPVAFFMRKGADCLSKWVGEAERQLRMLFDAAAAAAPSIIFFDEIDGLAPIHNSLVSTLLAMMDGASARGRVVVIGATNRVDAIDPALRRPGRFDRELLFPLPSVEGRKAILAIHTAKMPNQPSDDTLTNLAAATAGYGGSDLRALCTEATLAAFRRTYPAVYTAAGKYTLDAAAVTVTDADFDAALASVTPASARSSPAAASRLTENEVLLLDAPLRAALAGLQAQAPNLIPTSATHPASHWLLHPVPLHRPALCLVGDSGSGSSRLLWALAHTCQGMPVFNLSSTAIHSSPTGTAVADAFQELPRALPALIVIPDLDTWVDLVPPASIEAFLAAYTALPPPLPVLLLASSAVPLDELGHPRLAALFSGPRATLHVPRPSRAAVEVILAAHRSSFFSYQPGSVPETDDEDEDESLGATHDIHRPSTGLPAPAPLPGALSPADALAAIARRSAAATEHSPASLSDEAELASLEAQEEHALLELRIYLRNVVAELKRQPRLKPFVRPVSANAFPDYYDVIDTPLCLEDMDDRVSAGHYTSTAAFMADIKLIRDNAYEYNPQGDPARTRNRADEMYDLAASLIHRFDVRTLGSMLKRLATLRARHFRVLRSAGEHAKANVSGSHDPPLSSGSAPLPPPPPVLPPLPPPPPSPARRTAFIPPPTHHIAAWAELTDSLLEALFADGPPHIDAVFRVLAELGRIIEQHKHAADKRPALQAAAGLLV